MKETAFMEVIDRLMESGLTEIQAIELVALFLEEKKDDLKEEVIFEMRLTN